MLKSRNVINTGAWSDIAMLRIRVSEVLVNNAEFHNG